MDQQHEPQDRPDPDAPYAVSDPGFGYPDESFVYARGKIGWGEHAFTVAVLAVVGTLGLCFVAFGSEIFAAALFEPVPAASGMAQHAGMVFGFGITWFTPIVALVGCVFLRRKPLIRAFRISFVTALFVVVPLSTFGNMVFGLMFAVPVVLVTIVVLRFTLKDEECWQTPESK